MKSGSNVVVLVRIGGNVFAVKRTANGVRVLRVGTYTQRPPDQAGALNLLRKD